MEVLRSREGTGFCSLVREEDAVDAGRETWGRRSGGAEKSALSLGDPEPQTTGTRRSENVPEGQTAFPSVGTT